MNVMKLFVHMFLQLLRMDVCICVVMCTDCLYTPLLLFFFLQVQH